MKTIKNILYALFAVAALVMVGCTKDQTYTPGTDLEGAQIYIDNSKSVFYVQTAEEKEEEAKELQKMNHGLVQNAAYSDDSYVDLTVVRKGSAAEQYDFNVLLTMGAADAQLFTLPSGSKQTGADQTAKTVTYTVPCSFDADVAETVLRIGFDINNIVTNTEYEFLAELEDLENSSNYGASEHEFSIMHSLPIELPFEDIGNITLEETFFRDLLGVPVGIYSDCLIQIHKDDKKAIDDARAAGTTPKFAAGYVRFYIPRFMYQVASASVAAGDGAFDESDVEYFKAGCGIMVCMTPTYELVASDMAGSYPHPLHPDKVTTGYPRSPVVFVDSVDGGVYSYGFSFGKVYAGSVPVSISGYGVLDIVLFYPELGYSAASTRTMNTYTLNTSYFASATSNLWSTPVIFTWDKNNLEDDWANYFKIDYNNAINYSALGSGVFTSEYQGNFATKTLYKGVEEVSGNTVFYIYNPYGTVTTETGALGLALVSNGATASLADMQPLNMQWNGRELYASQSSKIKSSIVTNENGNITKIVLGLSIVNEEGQVLGDYTETFDIEAPEQGLSAFLGDFTQYCYELYGELDTANQLQSLVKSVTEMSSAVKIEQAYDKSGKPITNKVRISGLIPDLYNYGAGGYLEGTYDPTSHTIDVPAQFFHDLEWDGSQIVGQAISIFPYFQPCATTYGGYSSKYSSTGYVWISEADENAESIAIRCVNGMLQFGPSTNTSVAADGYSLVLGYYDSSYDEFVVDPDNLTLFTTFSWDYLGLPSPTLVPATAGGGIAPMQKQFAKKTQIITNSLEARKNRGDAIVLDLPAKK